MTAPDATPPTSATPAPAPSWREAWAVYLQPRVLIVLLLGFSSGLPLALSGSTLLVWMRESGVDLGTIGLFALVGTPYTLKFIWAPLVDALHVPVFTRAFGRRRGQGREQDRADRSEALRRLIRRPRPSLLPAPAFTSDTPANGWSTRP